ncbi:MAG TPA: F0F1 ATP synthase subunit A [Rubrivivax sp.]|mgnify:CR=1 FL=1|nr:F0F1 ATP synthase subunit A [Rubrivivax sp.]HPO17726.1 F0F1 ATP synthase subunit A [Rubrivivax sp.]
MTGSPLAAEALWQLGPVPISSAVVATWVIMLVLVLGARLATLRLSLRPSRLQAALELLVDTLDAQIRETVQSDPAPYRALIGTLFVYVLAANWSSLVPGVEPPTARLETDAALAGIVFFATIVYGLRAHGLRGYLASFAEPGLLMVPLNLVEQITRVFSLMVRLFGNVVAGVFVVGIALSLAGLFVPIPFMALELLIGAIQAYIFSVLAMVFIGAAVQQEGAAPAGREPSQTTNRRELP